MMSTFCFVPYWIFTGVHAKHNMFRCAVHKWISTNRCIPAMYERVRKLLGGFHLVPNAQWNIPHYDYLVQAMKDSMHGQDVFGRHFARISHAPLCTLEATIPPWASAKTTTLWRLGRDKRIPRRMPTRPTTRLAWASASSAVTSMQRQTAASPGFMTEQVCTKAL
jgi:hypothetical protein